MNSHVLGAICDDTHDGDVWVGDGRTQVIGSGHGDAGEAVGRRKS